MNGFFRIRLWNLDGLSKNLKRQPGGGQSDLYLISRVKHATFWNVDIARHQIPAYWKPKHVASREVLLEHLNIQIGRWITASFLPEFLNLMQKISAFANNCSVSANPSTLGPLPYIASVRGNRWTWKTCHPKCIVGSTFLLILHHVALLHVSV